MSLGGGGTQRSDQQYNPAQQQMQEMVNQYAYNAYHNPNRPDFQSGTQLYAPSGGERDVMSQWQRSLQGAQNWSPYNSSNNPYGGQGGASGAYTTGINDGRSMFGGQGGSSGEFTGITDTRSPYGGQSNQDLGIEGFTGGATSNNPAEEWYKRMQGAIGAGSQMPGLQGPDIRGPGPMQGPDIRGVGPLAAPDIRQMGPLNQAPTPEAALAAAQKNLSTITAPGLAQQAAATGGSMDSGAYLEALANAGTAASVPISQQQLAMQGQYGMQGNELMSQQNQQMNAILAQHQLQGNDIMNQQNLQGNAIRGQYGLQGNDINSQYGLQGNQIRGQYGMQANDLAGNLAQGRQNQLYGLEMAAPGMGQSMAGNNLDFENQRNQGLMGLAGSERQGQLQDYLRQQNYLQGAMGLLPTGAFSNPATNSNFQSSPGVLGSMQGFSQVLSNLGQGLGSARMGKTPKPGTGG